MPFKANWKYESVKENYRHIERANNYYSWVLLRIHRALNTLFLFRTIQHQTFTLHYVIKPFATLYPVNSLLNYSNRSLASLIALIYATLYRFACIAQGCCFSNILFFSRNLATWNFSSWHSHTASGLLCDSIVTLVND